MVFALSADFEQGFLVGVFVGGCVTGLMCLIGVLSDWITVEEQTEPELLAEVDQEQVEIDERDLHPLHRTEIGESGA